MQVFGSTKSFLLPTVTAHTYEEYYFITRCAKDKGINKRSFFTAFTVLIFNTISVVLSEGSHAGICKTARIRVSVHNYTGASKGLCIFLR